jgi:signal transduction histidine kinase
MKQHWNEYRFSWLILAAVMPALLVLGWLQYRWLDEASRAEQERVRAGLRVAAQNIGEAFDRELARAYLSFQIDAATLRDNDWRHFAARYDRWRETAPYPDMVAGLLLVEVDQIGGLTLYRFDPALERFEQQHWPADMVDLWRRLELAYRAPTTASPAAALPLDPVYEPLPALLVPPTRSWLLSDRETLDIDADLIFSDAVLTEPRGFCATCRRGALDAPLFAHTVVLLDERYIREIMLPSLLQRYLPAEAGMDFHAVVVSQGNPAHLVYASPSSLTVADGRSGDAGTTLFSIQYEYLNRLLLDNDFRSLSSTAANTANRVTIGIMGAEPQTTADSGAWRLLLKHRMGSLEAAVAQERNRNLVLNTGVLLVLAVSVVLLVLATQRARRLARRQMQFAAAVSHELRTPLAVIRSAGENLADGLVDEPQQARRYGMLIRDEGRRLSTMIEQVLEFASVQAGKKTYQFSELQLESLIRTALDECTVQTNTPIILELASDLPPVQGDANALRRSLQNLVSNALKYGDGSRVAVQARPASGERGAEIRISVRDWGAGIDAVDLPHIFEPFYRGRAVAASAVHGSGLGLSLVRHVIEAHGGRISVESTAGAGSCFIMHLPVAINPAGPVAMGEGVMGDG